MARACPVCVSESLRPLRVAQLEVGTCGRCHGLWFGRGAWARVPDRPPLRAFLDGAREAPARCRKGHPVPGARSGCAVCGGAPVGCPDCGARLARVTTRVCPVDVCARCEGLWVDAAGFSRLEGVTALGPVSLGPAVTGPATPTCSACAAPLQGRDAFAHEGELFCAHCRPPGAVPRRPPPRTPKG